MTAPLVSLAEVEIAMNEAVAIARRYFGVGSMAIAHEMKANATPVSGADIEIAASLKARLTRIAAGAGWRCEEEEDGAGSTSADLLWVVDPVDGTKEFVRGIPEVSISVALVAEQELVLSMVANPITGETGLWSKLEGLKFSGYPGGATRQATLSIADAVASVSRSEHSKGSLQSFEFGLKEIRPLGSVAYKLLRVAARREPLYFSIEPKSEWDICGGVALVWAAGLEYVRFDGVPIAFGSADPRIRSGAVAGQRELVAEFMRTFRGPIRECQLRIERGQVA